MRLVIFLVTTVALLAAKGVSGQTSPFDALAERELFDHCDPPCGDGFRCGKRGRCVEECSTSSDCGDSDDWVCNNGLCRDESNRSSSSSSSCDRHRDCDWGERCSGGECVSTSRDDSDTSTSFLSNDDIDTCSDRDSEDSCE